MRGIIIRCQEVLFGGNDTSRGVDCPCGIGLMLDLGCRCVSLKIEGELRDRRSSRTQAISL